MSLSAAASCRMVRAAGSEPWPSFGVSTDLSKSAARHRPGSARRRERGDGTRVGLDLPPQSDRLRVRSGSGSHLPHDRHRREAGTMAGWVPASGSWSWHGRSSGASSAAIHARGTPGAGSGSDVVRSGHPFGDAGVREVDAPGAWPDLDAPAGRVPKVVGVGNDWARSGVEPDPSVTPRGSWARDRPAARRSWSRSGSGPPPRSSSAGSRPPPSRRAPRSPER
jgi:hypothetical protein